MQEHRRPWLVPAPTDELVARSAKASSITEPRIGDRAYYLAHALSSEQAGMMCVRRNFAIN